MSELVKIKKIILEHVGKENGIKAPEIAEKIGIDPGPSGVIIRGFIRETIRKLGVPIGANTHYGYYLIQNSAELREYLSTLESWKHSIEDRKTMVNVAFYRHYDDEDLDLTREFIGPDDNPDFGDDVE